MGVFYEMYGSFDVIYCPEVEELIDRFNSEGGEIGIENLSDHTIFGETATLQVSGAQACSYSTVNDLEDIVREFNPYITSPATIKTMCDEGSETIYLGPGDPDEQESTDALEEIKGLVHDLTVDDLEELMTYIQNNVR
jgi:hypothetical protein